MDKEAFIRMSSNIQDAMVRGNIYIDNGCHLAPSCLECPFPVCYLDDALKVNLYVARLKEKEQVERTAAMSPQDAAKELGLSERTLFRVRRRVADYVNNGGWAGI